MKTIPSKIRPVDIFIPAFDREAVRIELWKGTPINSSGNSISGNEFIDIFASLIRKYQNKTTVFYAKKMNLSTFELSSAIKALSGISANQWIIEYLTLEACDLLRNTDKTITEIASYLSFSRTVFCTFFVRNMKCPPTEWRAKGGI